MNESAKTVELQLLRLAQELRDKEDIRGAAQTYAQVAKMFAAQSNFQDAATCFSNASDLYICSDMPSQATHAFHDAKNCSINAGKFFQAFAHEWNLLEFDHRQPDWASLSNAYERIGELFDATQTEKPVNEELLQTMMRWASDPTNEPAVSPYLSCTGYKSYLEFLKGAQQTPDTELRDIISITFGRAGAVAAGDLVSNLYFHMSAATDTIQSHWKELLASMAYTRACVAAAKTGCFSRASDLCARLSGIWQVIEVVWGRELFLDYKYRFYSDMEAAQRTNFQEADKYYFMKMQSYTDMLRLQKSKLYLFYKLWELLAGYGVSLIRASLTALAVPVLVFPLIYAFLDVSSKKGSSMLPDIYYLSFSVFVTLGTGDLSPSGWNQVAVTSEAISGYIVFGLLLTVIVRKMFRN